MPQLLLLLVGALAVGAIGFGIAALISGGDPGLAPVEPDGRAVPLPTDRPLGESDVVALRFDTGLRGYRMGQVDMALRRAAYDIGYKEELIGVLEAEVAREAIGAGADLVNDTWGGADPGLAVVAAETGAGLVCSHAGGLAPRTRPHRVAYADVVAEVRAAVCVLADQALSAGVRRDGLLIDPTHDFGKNTRHSLELTRRLSELVDTGWPVLVALSNKDFVGETLDLPVDDRLDGTLAATTVSAWLGARVFRAHQVRRTRRVLDMVASIRGYRPPAVARRGLA